MTPLSQLIAELAEQIPVEVGSVEEGARVAVTLVELELPVESSLVAGQFGASLPRGRWQSGVTLPQGVLFLRYGSSS